MNIISRRSLHAACIASGAAVAMLASPALFAADAPNSAQTAAAAKGTFKEWAEVLAIPNDSVVAADIQRNTAWFEQAFQRRGSRTQQLANDGRPMLFAELPGNKAGKPTVLFYAHLDGQAVTPSEWQQESPWKPTLKQRNAAGQWETLPIDQLYTANPNPEWRLFGRASADDKAPIMMMLAAFDALKTNGTAPAVNVKIILDSEEEKGSPSLGKVISEHQVLLKSDLLVVLDGPMHASNLPTLV